MEPSIYRYILKHSLRGQIIIVVLTAMSLPVLYAALEIPKIIVNRALGEGPIPAQLFGFEFDRVSYLLALCFAFLGLMVLNGAIKFVVQVYQGALGERMLRRLRYELYSRIQRFPLPHFKRVSQGEIIPMVVAETEPLGFFIGESFAVPALQGGTVLTYMFFIFNQDLLLGLAAIALYPFQIYLIPKLQRRINELSRERVRAARKLSDRIGEGVSGITEIHAHDTSRFERADISQRLADIFHIRYEIYRRKFLIKFLNNFMAHLTPFFFFSIGGYFVIRGQLSLGALVAVLAAFKDLTQPWKELFRYYEVKEDARVKYGQIIEQFDPPNMFEERLLDEEPERIEPLKGMLNATNVSYSEDDNVKIVDGANFGFELDQHVAIVGAGGSGKEELGRLVARLLKPTTGRISVDGRNLVEVPEAVLGRRGAYVDQTSHIFAGSIFDNLVYGLKHRPLRPVSDADEGAAARWEQELKEALRTGNSPYDIRADWIDYAAIEAKDKEELVEKAIGLLPLVEMDDDIYKLGLQGAVDPKLAPDLAERLLQARREVRERLAAPEFAQLVEPFDPRAFNTNMSVAENVLFGTPRDPSLDLENISTHPSVRRVLDETELTREFLHRGYKVAQIMVDLFADVPTGSELFEQFSFISADDLPVFGSLLARAKDSGPESLDADEQDLLRGLMFKLVPARHRLGVIDEEMQDRLLEVRRRLSEGFEAEAPLVEEFDPERYHPGISIQDNILFGKLVYGQAQAQARIGELVTATVDALRLRDDIKRVGLQYQVGIAGARLPFALRRKLAIARSLFKNPDFIVLNEATSALDTQVEMRILENIRAHMRGKGVVCVLGRAELARGFDRVLVMEGGKLARQGSFSELENSGAPLQQLLGAT